MNATLLLGTRNFAKLRELEELLAIPELTLRTIADYPDAPEVDETGSTFHENAALKATTLAKRLGRWVLGEDSGLCVDALGGRPGVFSARYAGEPCDDQRNNDKLLQDLHDVPDGRRSAYYVCVAVLSDPAGNVRASSEGRCPGQIVRQRRGSGGFGYDPLFLIPKKGKTFGELPLEFKHSISHRSRAIALLRPRIREILDSGGWEKSGIVDP